MNSTGIKVSVATLAGNDQFISNGFLESILNQTIAEEIELIVLAIGVQISVPESLAKKLVIKIIQLDAAADMLQAQILALKIAKGEVVAFLEDHCVAEKEWANQLFQASEEGWMSVVYAMKNGSPDTFYFRCVFLAEYGIFSHPVKSGEVNICPDCNVAYNRERLLNFLEFTDLDQKKAVALSWILGKEGCRIYLASGAIVLHKSLECMHDLFWSHFAVCRSLGHYRVIEEGWGMGRRLFYAVSVALCVPILQIIRLFRALGINHPQLKNSFFALPFLFALRQFAAFGESIGYLLGDRGSPQTLMHMELNAKRIGRE